MSTHNPNDTRTTESSKQFLEAGNIKWQSGELRQRTSQEVIANREDIATNGQFPKAIVITGSNALLSPSFVFDADQGDIFAIRHEGIPYSKAILESALYAIEHLGAPYMTVMAYDGFKGNKDTLSQAQTTAKELMKHPVISDAVAAGKLKVELSFLHKVSGKVEYFDVKDERISEISAEYVASAVEPLSMFGEEKSSPDAVLSNFAEGNKRVAAGNPNKMSPSEIVKMREHAATHGNTAIAVAATCADSRTSTERAVDAKYGEIHETRVAGVFITPELEQSVIAAAYDNIPVVMGVSHSKCGAIGAAMDNVQEENLKTIVTTAQAEIGNVAELSQNNAKDAAALKVGASTSEKMGALDVIQKAVASGKTKVVAPFFNILSGNMRFYTPAQAYNKAKGQDVVCAYTMKAVAEKVHG